VNLTQEILAGRILEVFLNEKRSQEAKNKVRKFKTLVERIRPSKFMTSPFSNFQFERLTSKVDGGMPTRDKAITRGENSSWVNSTLRNSVKDCKTYTGNWISLQLRREVIV
jgi:hypothetical protein